MTITERCSSEVISTATSILEIKLRALSERNVPIKIAVSRDFVLKDSDIEIIIKECQLSPYQKGLMLYAAKRYKEALETFKPLLISYLRTEEDPSDEHLNVILFSGNLSFIMGNAGVSEGYYKMVEEVFGEKPYFWNNLAMCYKALGRTEESALCLENVIKLRQAEVARKENTIRERLDNAIMKKDSWQSGEISSIDADSKAVVNRLINLNYTFDAKKQVWIRKVKPKPKPNPKPNPEKKSNIDNEKSSEVAESMTKTLGKLGSKDQQTYDFLLDAMKNNKDSEVRAAAAWTLGKLEDERAFDALVDVMKNEKSPAVRRDVAEALGKLGDERALVILLETLQDDKHANVRGSAAWAIGNIGDIETVDFLVDAVKKDKSEDVRGAAAWSIGNMGDESVIDVLQDVMDSDKKKEVQRMAEWAIAKIKIRAKSVK